MISLYLLRKYSSDAVDGKSRRDVNPALSSWDRRGSSERPRLGCRKGSRELACLYSEVEKSRNKQFRHIT